ncbi:MAG: hypothetical protein OXH57_11700 [Ekhidna sp.]|nr:hypothetical protein [Ekhidna sp.]
MKIKSISYPSKDEYYNQELIREVNSGIETVMGTVFLQKGSRIPNEGFSKHPFNEVSIIAKGCIEMLNEDGSILGYFEKGSVIYINAFEPQAGNVLKDTEIMYVLNRPVIWLNDQVKHGAENC